MRVKVNGETQELEEGTTLAELLERLAAPRQGIAVELNAAIVRKAEHASTRLNDGDRVEIVGLVGGG
ncbi:MAG: sulfur carrier protein ThiS [Planctomycetota bacterium]